MSTVDQKTGLASTVDGSVMSYVRAGWLRAVLFTLIWLILVDGEVGSWLIGVPVVLFATFASVRLLPGFSISVSGMVRFVPFFLWQSLRGGTDVAMRVLSPKLSIAPAMLSYRWRLPPGLSRVFMANVVSLLPGTLSAELEDDLLNVHVLDETADFDAEMILLEERVAQMFGLSLMAENNAGKESR